MNTAHNLRPAVARKLAKAPQTLWMAMKALPLSAMSIDGKPVKLFDGDKPRAAWGAILVYETAEAAQAEFPEVAAMPIRTESPQDPPKPPAKRARKHKETNNG